MGPLPAIDSALMRTFSLVTSAHGWTSIYLRIPKDALQEGLRSTEPSHQCCNVETAAATAASVSPRRPGDGGREHGDVQEDGT